MTLGSLFDGAGTVPLAAAICGIKTLWSSEIEKFPLEVTAKRFPDVKQLGDVTKIHGDEIEPVDIISFGSPCQDLSVAGKRAGLDGERSNLFMDAIRIIKEMRSKTDGRYPTFAVWENVPGAFSSNKGEDFRTVLAEFVKVKDSDSVVPQPPKGKWSDAGEIVGDGYSVAWRVLDAQFWGVPQRRRRIFLVADFGSERAGEILFKRQGLSRNFAESRRTWEGTPSASEDCFGTADSTALCVRERCGCAGSNGVIALENHPAVSRVSISEDGTVQTLTSWCGTGGGNVPLLMTYGICSKDSNAMKSDNPHSGFYEASSARTLDANGGNPSCNQGGMVVIEGNGQRPSHRGVGYSESETEYTLNSTEVHGVAYGLGRDSFNMGQNAKFGMSIDEEVQPPMTAKGPGGGGYYKTAYGAGRNPELMNCIDRDIHKGTNNQIAEAGQLVIEKSGGGDIYDVS